MRLISVVMGEENTDKRSSDTLAMLDYGFSMYSIDKIIDKSDILDQVKVNLGNEEMVGIKSIDDITILNKTQGSKKQIDYEIDADKITAPVKVGDIVGKISVYESGKYLYSVDITVDKDIDKANIVKITLRNLKDILGVDI